MDEDLGLDAGSLGDVANFFERKLSRQDDALEAQPGQNLRACSIVDGHLRAAVQLQLGKVTADGAENAQVLEDNGIDAHILQRGQGLDQLGQFILANERVDRDENPAARRQAMSVSRDLVNFIQREVFRLGPRGEFLQT